MQLVDTAKIDSVGRIVIPKPLRRRLDVAENEKVELFYDDNMLIIKKYMPSCVFCGDHGEHNEIISYKDKYVCKACIENILSLDSD